jgi:hypothetical protein
MDGSLYRQITATSHKGKAVPVHTKKAYGRDPHSSMMQQPLVGQGLLLIEPSRSHSETPHSVGLVWTNDRPVAETST